MDPAILNKNHLEPIQSSRPMTLLPGPASPVPLRTQCITGQDSDQLERLPSGAGNLGRPRPHPTSMHTSHESSIIIIPHTDYVTMPSELTMKPHTLTDPVSVPIRDPPSLVPVPFRATSGPVPVRNPSAPVPDTVRDPAAPVLVPVRSPAVPVRNPPVPVPVRHPLVPVPVPVRDPPAPVPVSVRSPPVPVPVRDPPAPVPVQVRSPPIPVRDPPSPVPVSVRSPPVPVPVRDPPAPVPVPVRSPPVPVPVRDPLVLVSASVRDPPVPVPFPVRDISIPVPVPGRNTPGQPPVPIRDPPVPLKAPLTPVPHPGKAPSAQVSVPVNHPPVSVPVPVTDSSAPVSIPVQGLLASGPFTIKAPSAPVPVTVQDPPAPVPTPPLGKDPPAPVCVSANSTPAQIPVPVRVNYTSTTVPCRAIDAPVALPNVPMPTSSASSSVLVSPQSQVIPSTGFATEAPNSSTEDFRVYIVTWNVGSAVPPDDITSLLGLSRADGKADVYIIGLQEMNSMINKRLKDALFTDPWTEVFMETLSGRGYMLVTSERMQGVLLLVFAKYSHLPFLRGVQTQSTRTGLGGYWGNKGGVSARVVLFGHSLCFLNCHLPAHMRNLEQRVDDFESILQQQQFQGSGGMGVLDHDLVFWFGDLNFRIEDYDTHVVKSAVESNKLRMLWEKDQLNKAKESEAVLQGFLEGPLTFPPTYKFDVGTHTYDTSAKKRKPAWTDRILWRLRTAGSPGPAHQPTVRRGLTSWLSPGLRVTQHSYCSHMGYTCSDHKPVSAIFSLQFPFKMDVPLVTLSVHKEWTKVSDASVRFQVTSTLSRSTWDWIGLYKENW